MPTEELQHAVFKGSQTAENKGGAGYMEMSGLQIHMLSDVRQGGKEGRCQMEKAGSKGILDMRQLLSKRA